MHKSNPIVILLILLVVNNNEIIAQNVGINETGASPDNSALLDLNSNDKGFLITRADTGNIASPAFGLMTLSPIDSCLYMYSGDTWISQGGVGINCSSSSPSGPPMVTLPCSGETMPLIEVTNPSTGDTWMDRNLGADQVATSSTDPAAYGDLYQWGRCSDGHEKRTSSTTTTLSSTDDPGHGDFITVNSTPDDWRSPQNNSLWQGTSGINNPCPSGYRLPTDSELDAERQSWSSNDAAGAFDSPLKLTLTGSRNNSPGTLVLVGIFGFYWSSSVNGTDARNMNFSSTHANFTDGRRATGLSVRCIKD